MKNIKLVFFSILLISLFSCKKEDPINELEDVFIVNLEVNDTEFEVENNQIIDMVEPNELGFHITNITSKNIRLKLTVLSLGGDGTGVELCFSQCRSNTEEGVIDIREMLSGITTTTNQAHLNPGLDFEGNLIVEFKINEVDAEDNDITDGKEVVFTYNYTEPK